MAKKKGGDDGGGPGQKAKAQKAASRMEKEALAKQKKEARVEANWKDGANEREERRRKEQEAKEAAKLAAKQAKLDALAADEAELRNMKPATSKARKASKKKKKNDMSMLDAFLEDENKAKAAKAKKSAGFSSAPKDLLKPNMNRANANAEKEGTISASGLDNALAALAVGEDDSKTPGRKALFMAFEEREMPRLKEEYPGLKRSQLKDKLWKEWQKSPDNPANQPE
mmetsp:Transcript_13725/g.22387  ORF Transcript_13725/g.22387 Transcript_13725/m.22387 type:complete len:227 (+) Transcript_13725:310-990(+)|eukprot:CAMPEP_0203764350 /NCGR_PEP_ID=MMETSP0098-20131031/17630_1 /ASSEMBLY_ACC=CAM_ASM_000208 /TAXON_ID=96639 /ORGANISM=" , Strain NY0313808BC1" /LENGTH=226 /DNA_ID=CAMNT_0050660179 /DNA_START=280 /DNA_END=960 /DNA_ORIENTATION=+